MSRPRVGFHVRVRERAIPNYAPVANIAPGATFKVIASYDNYVQGRAAVAVEDGDRRFLFWRGDVSALPRCAHCLHEGHTASRATLKNCAAKRDEKREARR